VIDDEAELEPVVDTVLLAVDDCVDVAVLLCVVISQL